MYIQLKSWHMNTSEYISTVTAFLYIKYKILYCMYQFFKSFIQDKAKSLSVTKTFFLPLLGFKPESLWPDCPALYLWNAISLIYYHISLEISRFQDLVKRNPKPVQG